MCFVFFFFKQKTAYEMRISDWSSDVCSSDLVLEIEPDRAGLRIVEIVLEQFVRLDIRAVPDRDQTAEAQAAPLAARDDVGAQAARLRHHADCAGFLGGVGREGEAAELGRAGCRERVGQYV